MTLTATFFAAQAVAAPDAPPRAEPSGQTKPQRGKAKAPPCVLDRAAQNPCEPPGPPKPAPLTRDRAKTQETGTRMIFDGPPKNALPFENDLSSVKSKNLGGRVGVEFPF